MSDRPQPSCDGDLLRQDLGDAALTLATAGFAALWRKRLIPARDLLGSHPDIAAEIIETQIAKGRLEIDRLGRLIGVHGLTLRATRHRFELLGHEHHTWCAFDSIGIPAALRTDATVHTSCPTCDRALDVEVHGGEPTGDELPLWLPAAPAAHLMNEFCASADLYCSLEHLHHRVDTAAGTVSNLVDAADLGRHVWADIADLGLKRDA